MNIQQNKAKPACGASRREFLTMAAAGVLAAPTAARSAAPGAGSKPNIIVILTDDQGYGDVGYQGLKDVPTPNMDSIARNGVQFTDGHVSCPVCSPTRAGLMTGRYQHRFGHEFNPGPPNNAEPEFGLPLSQITLADLLKQAGYATGMVGKWHLGLQPQFHPLKRGFDEYFGFLHGAHDYLDAKRDPANLILRGTEPVDEKEYLTDAFTREAVAFIEKHKSRPFFLYLTYNAIHTPMQAVQKYLDRFKDVAVKNRQIHNAMLSALDDGIGAVLAKLREAGIEENTLVFFLSDNGGPTPTNTSSNAPLRGYKGQLYEGGHRVPFALQWKAKIKGGQVVGELVSALDILPTALAAAGADIPRDRPMDGVNLLPYLLGEKTGAPHEVLVWRQGDRRAVRKGHWKWIEGETTETELYDLSKDISESNNLAAQHPEKVKELAAAFEKWNAEMVPPLWKTQRAAGARAAKKAAKKAAGKK
ncbi:MAG: sulfatase-like hydrolase/transferase [Candidatus Sumerlaeia bacterium]|nr:sulfatase-like hydrolase/transferase [Candidatus Sumerlaeia bacterium]